MFSWGVIGSIFRRFFTGVDVVVLVVAVLRLDLSGTVKMVVSLGEFVLSRN